MKPPLYIKTVLPTLDRNTRIMLALLVTLTDKTRKYMKCEHIVFPKDVLKSLNLGVVYLEKVLSRFYLSEITESDRKAVINRLDRLILKLPPGTNELAKEDFQYLVIMDLGIMLVDEILEKQRNIPKAVKTYLKTGRTYYKKFLSFVAEELK